MVFNPREKRDLGEREDEHCQTKGKKKQPMLNKIRTKYDILD